MVKKINNNNFYNDKNVVTLKDKNKLNLKVNLFYFYYFIYFFLIFIISEEKYVAEFKKKLIKKILARFRIHITTILMKTKNLKIMYSVKNLAKFCKFK